MRPHSVPLSLALALALTLTASTLSAATPPSAKEEMARLNDVAALVDARRLIRLHENGTKLATADELAAAHRIIAQAEEKEDQRVRAVMGIPTGELVLELKNVDLPTVAQAWKSITGLDGPIILADSLKGKTVTLSIRALTAKSLRIKLTSALAQLGIHANRQTDGSFVFDAVPVSSLRPTSATPAEEAARLAEVAREVAARRFLREHAVGTKKISESDLAAARLVVAHGDEQREQRVRAFLGTPAGDIVLEFKNADLPTVARAWKGIFGFDVAIADSLKAHTVTLSVRAPALPNFSDKFTAALKQNGIYEIWRKDGTPTLDTSPEKSPSR